MKTHFHSIFFTLVSITFISGGTSLYLANHPNPNDQQIGVFNTCTDTWKLCVGAIAGLLGGRNLSQSEDSDSEDSD
jgi:hypothetical protein